MFIHYRTLGLILKKEDRGETNQLFTIYTRDLGKLEILGKAIRKISSKLRSGADIFYLSEIEFIQGKAYKTLTDAILIDKFENIRKDPKRLRIAYKISEILDNLIRGQEADENIWQLLNETFQKLNDYNLKPKIYSLIYYYFLWNFLSILGYQPEIYHCAICQNKLKPEKIYFSQKEKGIICQNCSEGVKPTKEIKIEIVKILRVILKKDWRTLSKLKIEPQYINSLALISKEYLSSVLELIK
jgi:DNA repair protein RecO (recombination protein O)